MSGAYLAGVSSWILTSDSAFIFRMNLFAVYVFEDEFGEGAGCIFEYGGDDLISFHE